MLRRLSIFCCHSRATETNHGLLKCNKHHKSCTRKAVTTLDKPLYAVQQGLTRMMTSSVLANWINSRLRLEFPHQCTMLLTGTRHCAGISFSAYAEFDVPPPYLRWAKSASICTMSPAIERWFRLNRSTLLVADRIRPEPHETEWYSAFRASGFRNVFIDAYEDVHSRKVTLVKLFNFTATSTNIEFAIAGEGSGPARLVHQIWHSTDAKIIPPPPPHRRAQFRSSNPKRN